MLDAVVVSHCEQKRCEEPRSEFGEIAVCGAAFAEAVKKLWSAACGAAWSSERVFELEELWRRV